MKWWNLGTVKKSSKNNKRFLTDIDMMEAKRLESVHNAEVKRKEKEKLHTHLVTCGCGREGCIIVR